MMNLRNYATKRIEQAARDVNDLYTTGLIDQHQFGAQLSQFLVRDRWGMYWAYEPRRGKWHYYDGQQWTIGANPPSHLEGPEGIGVDHSLSIQEFQALMDREERQLSDPSPQQPATQVLPEIVAAIAHAYSQGDISLEDELAMLAEHFLVDRLGRPWAVGVRSRNWYLFESGAWRQANAAPSETEILRSPFAARTCPSCGRTVKGEERCPYCRASLPPVIQLANQEAAATLAGFLFYHLGELPEAPSEPWTPPAWYPEAANIQDLTCPQCQVGTPPGSKYCNRCGSLLETEETFLTSETPTLHSTPAMRLCPSCQTAVHFGEKVCPNCGKPLELPR
jgi:RNA polymerase subunit RPABC4/transcription elongation factor Spt4